MPSPILHFYARLFNKLQICGDGPSYCSIELVGVENYLVSWQRVSCQLRHFDLTIVGTNNSYSFCTFYEVDDESILHVEFQNHSTISSTPPSL
jgi:hypothetical protein